MKIKDILSGRLIGFTLRSISIVLFIFIVLAYCRCSPDDEDTWQIVDDGMVSSWMLKSAVFRSPVDLDGPGNMLPTSDAKSVIYGLFDMYGSCGSIDDLPIKFTTEPASDPGLATGMFGSQAYSAYAICPDGQGVTAWVCDYIFSDNSGNDYQPLLYLLTKDEVDPGLLFDWQGGIILRILSSEVIGGKYTIAGELREGSLISTLPEPKPDLTFDFVMERIDPHL